MVAHQLLDNRKHFFNINKNEEKIESSLVMWYENTIPAN